MRIKIIYGTGGGNTEIVCERVKNLLVEAGFEVELKRAKVCKPEDLEGNDLLILASPTYGHGLLEQYMDKLISKSGKVNLQDCKCAIIGLGDTLYDIDYLVESAKILTQFSEERGAEIMIEPLMITKNPLPYLKKVVPAWTKELVDNLQK